MLRAAGREVEGVGGSYLTPEDARKPHKSYGYLRTPELSAHIRDAL